MWTEIIGSLVAELGFHSVASGGYNDFIKKLNFLEKRTARVGLGLTGLTAAAGIFGAKAVTAFADIETSMAEIEGLTGTTKETFTKTMLPELRKFRREYGVELNKLVDDSYYALSSNLNVAESLDAVNMAARGATAGIGEQRDLVNLATGAMKAYKAEGMDARKVMDITARAVEVGKLEPEMMVPATARFLSQTAKMGIELEEALGILSIWSIENVAPDQGATQLRAIMRSFVKPQKMAVDYMKEMGETPTSMLKSIADEGLFATLEKVVEHAAGDEIKLARFFQHSTALIGVQSLFGGSVADNKRILSEMENYEGLMEKAFQIKADTVAFKWQSVMYNTNRGAEGELGEMFLADAHRVLDWVLKMQTESAALGGAMTAVHGMVKNLGFSMFTLASAGLLVSGVFGASIAGLVSGFVAVGSAMYVVIKYWDQLHAFVGGFWPRFKSEMAQALPFLNRAAESSGRLASAWERIEGTVSGVIERIRSLDVPDATPRNLQLLGGLGGEAARYVVSLGKHETDTLKSIARQLQKTAKVATWQSPMAAWEEDLDGGVGSRASPVAVMAEAIDKDRDKLQRSIWQASDDIMDYLPGSDAKKGPMSRLTEAGRSLWLTFASGMRAGARALAAVARASMNMIKMQIAIGVMGISGLMDVFARRTPAKDFGGFMLGMQQGAIGGFAREIRKELRIGQEDANAPAAPTATQAAVSAARAEAEQRAARMQEVLAAAKAEAAALKTVDAVNAEAQGDAARKQEAVSGMEDAQKFLAAIEDAIAQAGAESGNDAESEAARENLIAIQATLAASVAEAEAAADEAERLAHSMQVASKTAAALRGSLPGITEEQSVKAVMAAAESVWEQFPINSVAETMKVAMTAAKAVRDELPGTGMPQVVQALLAAAKVAEKAATETDIEHRVPMIGSSGKVVAAKAQVPEAHVDFIVPIVMEGASALEKKLYSGSGSELWDALASGMRGGQDAVEGAAAEGAEGIADYLPGSDARKGPLSNLTGMGEALWSTLGTGMKSGAVLLVNMAKATLGMVQNQIAIAALSTLGAMTVLFGRNPLSLMATWAAMQKQAGIDFWNTLTRGLRSGRGGVEGEVRDAVQGMADYLPGSNAKRGPLSNLTGMGQSLWDTFLSGMRRSANVGYFLRLTPMALLADTVSNFARHGWKDLGLAIAKTTVNALRFYRMGRVGARQMSLTVDNLMHQFRRMVMPGWTSQPTGFGASHQAMYPHSAAPAGTVAANRAGVLAYAALLATRQRVQHARQQMEQPENLAAAGFVQRYLTTRGMSASINKEFKNVLGLYAKRMEDAAGNKGATAYVGKQFVQEPGRTSAKWVAGAGQEGWMGPLGKQSRQAFRYSGLDPTFTNKSIGAVESFWNATEKTGKWSNKIFDRVVPNWMHGPVKAPFRAAKFLGWKAPMAMLRMGGRAAGFSFKMDDMTRNLVSQPRAGTSYAKQLDLHEKRVEALRKTHDDLVTRITAKKSKFTQDTLQVLTESLAASVDDRKVAKAIKNLKDRDAAQLGKDLMAARKALDDELETFARARRSAFLHSLMMTGKDTAILKGKDAVSTAARGWKGLKGVEAAAQGAWRTYQARRLSAPGRVVNTIGKMYPPDVVKILENQYYGYSGAQAQAFRQNLGQRVSQDILAGKGPGAARAQAGSKATRTFTTSVVKGTKAVQAFAKGHAAGARATLKGAEVTVKATRTFQATANAARTVNAGWKAAGKGANFIFKKVPYLGWAIGEAIGGRIREHVQTQEYGEEAPMWARAVGGADARYSKTYRFLKMSGENLESGLGLLADERGRVRLKARWNPTAEESEIITAKREWGPGRNFVTGMRMGVEKAWGNAMEPALARLERSLIGLGLEMGETITNLREIGQGVGQHEGFGMFIGRLMTGLAASAINLLAMMVGLLTSTLGAINLIVDISQQIVRSIEWLAMRIPVIGGRFGFFRETGMDIPEAKARVRSGELQGVTLADLRTRPKRARRIIRGMQDLEKVTGITNMTDLWAAIDRGEIPGMSRDDLRYTRSGNMAYRADLIEQALLPFHKDLQMMAPVVNGIADVFAEYDTTADKFKANRAEAIAKKQEGVNTALHMLGTEWATAGQTGSPYSEEEVMGLVNTMLGHEGLKPEHQPLARWAAEDPSGVFGDPNRYAVARDPYAMEMLRREGVPQPRDRTVTNSVQVDNVNFYQGVDDAEDAAAHMGTALEYQIDNAWDRSDRGVYN